MSVNRATTDEINETPLVSVVMANYNMGAYVGSAIQSICEQTVRNIEIIVVDDGSSDESWKVICDAAASDSRIVPIRQANAGQASAKNAGVRVARGDYIGFCDADDLWKPNKIEDQLNPFEDPTVGVVYTDLCVIDQEGRQTGQSNVVPVSGWVLQTLFFRNFVPFSTAIVRKSAFDECGLFNEQYRMGIDWDLWLRIARKYQFVHVRAWTTAYRSWDGQMSKNWRGRYEWVTRIMTDFLREFPGEIDAAGVRRAWGETYLNRGWLRAESGGERLRGTVDVLRGLSRCPQIFWGWKLLLKIWLLPLRRPSISHPADR
jgi:glycosyltransferase involved in cell wall biosynthesis